MTRAIIADDEEPLLQFLSHKLSELWPDLDIVGEATQGNEALELIERLQPDVAFLDIKMPGLSGLEVASRLSASACRIVFVTAYDQFALDAFEHRALDYLLKPVTDERLKKTIERLREPAALRSDPKDLERLLSQVSGLLGRRDGAGAHLRWIRASIRDSVRQIPVEEILYFRAADKYTVVETEEPSQGELLIRLSLAELLEQLDPDVFWQIHRSVIVNLSHVRATRRDVLGKTFVQLKQRGIELAVSRQYASRFKQM
ncbi:MAG: LytTR family DNA-binding domain-containing protein [Burkholderiaceae bacterium]|jgi:DNA-binding LytR/AlgR family response regulator